jgi:hypothetical protein
MALRARILIAVSVALNALLTWMVVREAREVPVVSAPHPANRLQNSAPKKGVKTNVIIRRQYFNWSDVESDDYQTYVANLKSIGCPPATIRDIIVADVNQLYGRRAAAEIVTGDQQWWLSEPDPDVLEAAAEKADALESERRQLLDGLLGPGWDYTSGSPAAPSRFSGAVLASVTPEARQAVQGVELESARRYNEYAQAQKAVGKPLDPGELTKLRLATRSDLAKILSPAQLEEYLLRYSANATSLRANLKGFEASQDEFRAIFRARDNIDSQLSALYASDDPASIRKRAELEKARDAAVEQSLGPERFSSYKLIQDPLFQQAQAAVEQSGAPPEKIMPMYQINQLTQQEKQRIEANKRLTPEQRAQALQTVEFQQQQALQKVLGEFGQPDLPPTPPGATQ